MKAARPHRASTAGNALLVRLPLGRCLLLAWIVLGLAARAIGADATEQYWLVSTRGAPHCGQGADSIDDLCYWRLDTACCWSSSDAGAFFATDDIAVPTVLFLHGNQTDAEEAQQKARYVYRQIRCQASDRPFRYVVWSWPADRVCRDHRDDACLKAAYSDVEGYYLAQWLRRMRPGVKVSLLGHSFGPRIIAGALHLLGGGQLGGRTMPQETVAEWAEGKRNPVRAVFLAAAIDADSLATRGRCCQALPLVDRMLITCNPCDRVLRWYPRVFCDEALGSLGPCGIAQAGNVEVLDVQCEVGKFHDWQGYCSAPSVCRQWTHYAFLDETSAP